MAWGRRSCGVRRKSALREVDHHGGPPRRTRRIGQWDAPHRAEERGALGNGMGSVGQWDGERRAMGWGTMGSGIEGLWLKVE